MCIGPNDLDLMLRLAKAGSVDGKFRRMIAVYVDITAPLYWWKEFDTYKVGTVANSCSTMHKIHAKEFTLEDFSHDHLIDYELLACNEVQGIVLRDYPHVHCGGMQMLHLMPVSRMMFPLYAVRLVEPTLSESSMPRSMATMFTIFLLNGNGMVRLLVIFAILKWRRTRMLWWPFGTVPVSEPNT